MMNEPLHMTEDRLIDLVNHLLSEAEERTMLSHIEQCATCEERLRLAIADRETARSTPAPSVRPDGKGVIALPRRHPRRLGAIALTVAAAAAIAAVAYMANHRSEHESYWIPIGFESSSLRSAESVSAGSSSAFHAYESHDAEKTIELLKSASPTDDEMIASLQRLMLASAYVNDKQPKEALYVLEKLEIFSLPVKWREQAQWVEYLALRDSGQKDEARARLDKLATYDSEIGARARAARK